MNLSPRRLLTNAGSQSAAFLAQLAAAFFLAPVVLAAIGDEKYGAWSFAESFVAYLTIFDMGVAAALVRFAPRAITRGDDDELTRLFSAAVTFFAVGGTIALVLGGLFALIGLPRIVGAGAMRAEFLALFLILVANFALTLPLSVFPAMLDAQGRFAFKSGVRSAALALRVALTIAVLQFQPNLIWLGIVLATCNIGEHLVLAAGVFRSLPRLRYRPMSVDRATIRQIAGYSRDAVVALFAGRLAFHTDAFVISPTLGMAAVTPFALASRLVEMTKSLLRSATTTLTSAFSSLEAAGDHDRLRATFLAGSRAAWYAGLTAQAGLLLLGPAFLTLWVGHRHAEAGRPVLLALGSVVALSVAQSVASRVLYGLGRLRGFARGTLAEGASNLAISLALVGPFGIAGVAVGTAVPHAAFCVFVLVVVCRLTGVRPTAYVRQIAPAVMAVAPAAMFWAAMARRGIGRWPEWFAVAGVGVAIVAISLAVVEFRLPGRVRSWLATRRRQYAAR